MPLVLDDVFMTADDERAAQMFRALENFAVAGQVLVFTHHHHHHHHHHLLDIASAAVSEGAAAAPAGGRSCWPGATDEENLKENTCLRTTNVPE